MMLGIFVLLLIAAVVFFLMIGLRRTTSANEEQDRDQLNVHFYQQQLQELEQNEAQGMLGEGAAIRQELRQNLSNDVIVTPISSPDTTTFNRWILLPGVLILVVITSWGYIKNGGWEQMASLQRTLEQLPTLREKFLNEESGSLTKEELKHLAMGIRTQLQSDRDNLSDWVILGRIGMVLNDADMAIHSFAQAYQLAPGGREAALGYAQALARSNDPEHNQQSIEILDQWVHTHQQDTQALSILAFKAFELQDYPKAIASWERMLPLLSEDSPQRAMIERSVIYAKEMENRGGMPEEK